MLKSFKKRPSDTEETEEVHLVLERAIKQKKYMEGHSVFATEVRVQKLTMKLVNATSQDISLVIPDYMSFDLDRIQYRNPYSGLWESPEPHRQSRPSSYRVYPRCGNDRHDKGRFVGSGESLPICGYFGESYEIYIYNESPSRRSNIFKSYRVGRSYGKGKAVRSARDGFGCTHLICSEGMGIAWSKEMLTVYGVLERLAKLIGQKRDLKALITSLSHPIVSSDADSVWMFVTHAANAGLFSSARNFPDHRNLRDRFQESRLQKALSELPSRRDYPRGLTSKEVSDVPLDFFAIT